MRRRQSRSVRGTIIKQSNRDNRRTDLVLNSQSSSQIQIKANAIVAGCDAITSTISSKKKDIESFERNFAIVKTYYDEFDGILPLSQKKYCILGLYLLYLLSFNKISEYHTEIELIPFDELNNVYIKVPMSLEQYFVEGSYNKILN